MLTTQEKQNIENAFYHMVDIYLEESPSSNDRYEAQKVFEYFEDNLEVVNFRYDIIDLDLHDVNADLEEQEINHARTILNQYQ